MPPFPASNEAKYLSKAAKNLFLAPAGTFGRGPVGLFRALIFASLLE
jgi:hypothetical protein